ncbi:MAG: chemotaxis protein CheX [Candidatus Tectomicrobia bacterium]|uniref:Chemotaxis protein CheX n=1 Tax=Tectimicrobiota bacterium TaxID=2528274 RepID=A0A932G0D4_UNCTE|nr:chemotaxis protein CheX [Candidatus Tectomicrobia bacterium]
MDVTLLNPFISAVSEILEKEVGIQPSKGRVSLQKAAHTTEEVTILIRLAGHIEGMVAYGMSEATAKAFISQMMGQEWSVLDELAQSALGELGSMVAGLAKTELLDRGYETSISPPLLILHEGALVSTLDMQRLVVTMETPNGPVQVHLSLRKGKVQGWFTPAGVADWTKKQVRESRLEASVPIPMIPSMEK